MSSSSTSHQPLVAKVKRRQKKQTGWWTRTTSSLTSFNLSKIWGNRPGSTTARSVYHNEPLPQGMFDRKGRILKEHKYPTNQNITSKYTIITFLPRNLLEQFRRVANVFFLGIAILQFFPKFSTISPGLVILPLLVVLAITAGKDGYEDVKRHQADRHVNNSIVHVLQGPGHENKNHMQGKEKTFVPRIPIPSRKSKKAREGAKDTTDILKNYRANQEAEPPEPAPHGQTGTRSQINRWLDDPDAMEGADELGWHRVAWEDVKVGDIVKIYENEQFPADLVICSTSEEEDVAYIETKNLDGETNLKSRNGVPGLSHMVSAADCAKTRIRIDMDKPEVNMFRLNGAVVTLDEMGNDGEPAIHPITLESTLLRGCVLRNTAWVVGIIVFTGADTKIIANSGGTPSKRSRVEKQMNPQVLLNLAILAVIGLVCAIVDHYAEVRWYQEGAYWELYADTKEDNPNINGLFTFFNAFITFQNIVPISLYISIEVVRTSQALFIYWDPLICQIKDGVKRRTNARSWTLSDDLGQIQYIFSDKTGTLTQNAMIFRQCSIGGKVYVGDGEVPSGTLTNGKEHKEIPSNTSDDSSEAPAPTRNDPDEIKVALPKEVLQPFHDAELEKDLADHDSEQSRILHGFFAVLGLCHTVLAAEPEPGVIEYKAQSPDEAALVQSAADVGFVFRGRDHNIVRLSTPFSDHPDEYELLHVLEFNSTRKRMSVILRKMDDEGRIFLLCKGADNVIFERLTKDESQRELRQKTDKDLQQFASEGLRTLCLAYKVLDQKVYDRWAKEYHEATVALQGREELIENVSNSIEQDLILLGATAIEDKLQDGVPEAISDLKRAGMKVWVLTGDKLETAVAIGYTTHLLTTETNLIIVREGARPIQDQLRDALDGFFGDNLSRHASRREAEHYDTAAPPQLDRINTGVRSLVGHDNGTRPGGFSLVIEGHALAHAFDDQETSDLLLALSTQCNTVICCRVSPLQKAQVVHLVKDNLGVMCLAIGDGANDVSMIQAADVGVGISGEEGLQAVNSSDYAIAQFRFLKRLLLVHGHWSYFRNSSMILNFFYKNIIGIGVLFWFMIYCEWSTTYVFAYVYLLFWNVFWTLLPVIAIGLFDKNIDADILMAIPELYRFGREQTYFGMWRFVYYLMEGVYQSAVIYFFLDYTYVTTSARGDGWNPYIYEMSTTMVIGAVMIANLFSGLNLYSWNWWALFGILLGPFLIWVFTAIYSIIPPSSFYTAVYGNDIYLFRSAAFWFGWPFVLIVALLPRYLFKAYSQLVTPNDIEILRLVRKFNPDIDFESHPLLGGKLKAEQGKTLDMEDMLHGGAAHENVIPMMDIEANRNSVESQRENGGPRPSYQGRPSMASSRFGVHSSARGSQVDMSTGLSQAPSRGFDFTTEERGVAMQRMQSRLSEHSAHRQKFRSRLFPASSNHDIPESGHSNPFGFSKIRERAGSVLSRKRAGTASTRLSADDVASSPPNTGLTTTSTGTPRKGSMLRNVEKASVDGDLVDEHGRVG
ncbi:putative phospholipid-translocating ATPase [Kockovaella imperatae]|uniref:Phospholipid-transporting ATPase n=1 Tax=Kockovaella imperatae TaxID=4999 RepID=A0A1Y1UDU4_9TREE|nr:putative phospholipid-translocating ATPase [Kockovaella imperatae]ORX36159.1 putative phospholipid-translocating ATPase [Kockovaella imperatae]